MIKECIAHCGCKIPIAQKYIDKHTFFCSECHGLFCEKHIYFYVDGNNGSITKNSKPHCKECYIEKYGENK